ncbi:MAG TPA: hypothetical protein VF195_08625 [Actinomycetota bacterium]
MITTRTAEELSAPLGTEEEGYLVFSRGGSHLTIGVDGSMEDLFRASFDGKVPHTSVDRGTLTVKYRPTLHPPRGEMTLSGKIPWAIKARMGMSDVVADLADLQLTDLEISGGASKIAVKLPRPNGTVRIRFGGGASNVELVRPAGVPVRLRIGAGTSRLEVDDLRIGAAGGKTDWRSPAYDDAVDGRYDIEIGAGASKVTIRT